MSKRMTAGKPKLYALQKRRQSARHLREADEARFYLLRHRRKQQPPPG
jgi:hypothetical protein